MIEFGNVLPHDIHISGSANKGFIVKTGCCTTVFTDKNSMLAAIEDYINDPDKMEKLYNESCTSLHPQEVEVTSSGRSDPRNEECHEDCAPDSRR